jgi:glucose-6-phosphate isomerase, archaeal
VNPPSAPQDPQFRTNWSTGTIEGSGVETLVRKLSDLGGVFADERAFASLDPDRLVYRTECVFPVPEGTPGGVFWGTTFIEPGLVGNEFHMTKGHFHAQPDRTEIYFTFAGSGLLVLMSRDRRCWAERMSPGSTHFIPPFTAHRTVNTGDQTLAFGASWPSDAGHDYASIAADGFAARVLRVDGRPQLVPA